MSSPITLIDAAIYSIGNASEVAYQVTYSDGSTFRAVLSAGGWIRKEWKNGDQWELVGKPYVIKKDKKRQGERLIEAVKAFLA